MIVVPEIDDARLPISARKIWERVVFLPWYPDMPAEAVDKMANLVKSAEGNMGPARATSWQDADGEPTACCEENGPSGGPGFQTNRTPVDDIATK